MDEFSQKDKLKNIDSRFKQDIYSKVVRAGKRTYFFDVKFSRTDEFYLTITESKKRFENDGSFVYEKHKIFLYKEDFAKFIDNLQGVIDYIYNKQPFEPEEQSGLLSEELEQEVIESNFTDIRFEDLNN
jgi:hypothetical protein